MMDVNDLNDFDRESLIACTVMRRLKASQSLTMTAMVSSMRKSRL